MERTAGQKGLRVYERMRVVEVMLSLAFHAPDTTHGLAALHSLPPLHTAVVLTPSFLLSFFVVPHFVRQWT